jgi:hypothetical protein
MATATPNWVRVNTPAGRYEYQFHGHAPAVRGGKYLEARDYLFLVMDEERWLYRIPVQVTDEVAGALTAAGVACDADVLAGVAEKRLCEGLQSYQPKAKAAYEELDRVFSVDGETAVRLAGVG